MVSYCRRQENSDGLAMWQYALAVVDRLGVDGMSEEEDGEAEIEGTRTRVLNVLKSLWRHDSITSLLHEVDRTRRVESKIFARAGGSIIPRIHVETLDDDRFPPRGLPPSFFKPGYFSGPRWTDEELLQVKTNEAFPLLNFNVGGPESEAV